MAETDIIIDRIRYRRIREVAAAAGISTGYLSKFCREGSVRATRVDGVWFVNEVSLRDFLDSRESRKREWHERLARERLEERGTVFAPSASDPAFTPLPASRVAPRTLHRIVAQHRAQEAAARRTIAVASIGTLLLLSSIGLTFSGIVPAAPARDASVASIADVGSSIFRKFTSFFDSLFAVNDYRIPPAWEKTIIQDPASAPRGNTYNTTNNNYVTNTNYIQPNIGSTGGISEQILESRLNAMENYLTGRIELAEHRGDRQAESLADSFADGIGGGGFEDIDIVDSSFTGGSISGATLSGVSFAGETGFSSLSADTASTTNATSSNLYVSGSFGFGSGTGLMRTTNGAASTLPNGSNGQVLKMVGGNLQWSTDLTGSGGGGASFFASTTDDLAIYPADPDDVVIIGDSATTTVGNILEVAGDALVRGGLTAYGDLTSARFVATSSAASILPYASTTALSATALCLSSDCRTAWPSFTDTSFSTTSADYWKSVNNFFATSSADAWKLTRDFFSTTSISYFLSQNQGAAFSTTSAGYWKSMNDFFSTTSAAYFLTQNGSLGFSTTSTDYWMTQRDFFSTTSANYWESQQTPRTADNLTDNSIEDLNDVAAMTKEYGDLLYWNGSSWADIATSSLGLVRFSDLSSSLSGYLSLAAWYATTTDALAEGGANRYFTAQRVQDHLDTVTKGFFFSTTSADAWKDQRNFFSTTSTEHLLSTYGKGFFFSTTSASYFLSEQGTLGFSTTSSDYWATQRDFFSTTSANYFAHSSTTIPKTYAANAFTALQTFGNASSSIFSATTLCLSNDCRTSWPAAGSSFEYPFFGAGNSTSTLTQFHGGLTAYASTTVGNGTAAGGLTISGTATTSRLVVTSTATSTFGGDILMLGSIIPSLDNTYSLGSMDRMWKDVYIGPGSLYVNGQKVIEDDGPNIVVTADPGQNLAIQSQGTGDIELSPLGTGVIQLKGSVQLTAGNALTMSDNSPVSMLDGAALGNITISGNTIQATNTNGGISLTPAGNGGTYITAGNLGIGTTSPGSKLSIAGDMFATGNIISSSLTASRLPYASTTALSATTLCLTGDSCISSWPSFIDTSFSTTSADFWQTQRDFFSTTSADYYKSVNNFFSTTSADYWKSASNFFSTTSASYFLAQNQGAAFSTTSADHLLSTYNKGFFFSTTSANHFLTQNGSLGFSTTSNDHWMTQRNFFSTTSADAWKDQRNFFSTSSASYFSSLGLAFSTTSADAWKLTRDFFSTTSSNYWQTTRDFFSTTSAMNFVNSSTTIPKTYTANAFTALQTFTNASSTLFSTNYASSTSGFFGNLSIGSLSGFLKATAGSIATAAIDLASDVTGILGVARGGTGWSTVQAGSLIYGNGSSALATTSAGTGGQVLALVGNVPTWVATTTFSSGLTYSNGNVTLDSTGDWTGTFDGLEGSAYLANSFSTTSADYWKLNRDFFSTTSAIYFAHSSTTIPKTYTANTYTGLQIFTNASSTLFSSSYASSTNLFAGAFTLGSLNGPLQANNGLVSATTSIGVLYGGTGLTAAPGYGQLLMGNGSGGYTLMATSSLGITGGSTGDQIAIIIDQKDDGTNGGSSTAGSWLTRDINTEITDAIGVSISSNQFTLPAGTYMIQWSAPAVDLRSHQTRLYNVSDATVAQYGQTAYADDGGDVANHSEGVAYIAIDASKAFRIEHRTEQTKATTGFGLASSFTGNPEIYTTIQIRKLNGSATVATFTGATATANGTAGLVPQPLSGEQGSVLLGDGSWLASTTLFVSTTTARIGIGTTTPGSILSIGSLANFTTATSTFYSTGGINLTSGCFAVNGTCIGGGGGSSNWSDLGTFLSPLTSTDGIIVAASSTIGNGSQAGGLTISGGATTTGDLRVGGNFGAAGLIEAGSLISAPSAIFSTGIESAIGGFSSLFAGTASTTVASAYDALYVGRTATTTIRGDNATSSIAGALTTSGSLGIGTTTPASLLSLAGTSGIFASTTATSTFFGGGINLVTSSGNTGCFAINGTCIGGGGSLTGTQGQVAYFSGTDTAIGTSTLFISSSEKVGIGTTTPWAKLSVSSYNGGTTPLFAVASSTGAGATSTAFLVDYRGNVGIGTTTTSTLDLGQANTKRLIVDMTNLGGYFDAGLYVTGTRSTGGLFTLMQGIAAEPAFIGTGTGADGLTQLRGGYFAPANTGGGAVDTSYGVLAAPRNSFGTTSNLYGLYGRPTLSGGTTTQMVGVYSELRSDALFGQIDAAYGFFGNPTFLSSGTVIGSYYGLYLDTPISGSTNITGGRYGIYQADALATNVLDGVRTGIGTTSPFAKLSVHAAASNTNTTLFAIASSTNAATTTLFSISNTGSTTAANGFNITAGCYAVGGVCLSAGGSFSTTSADYYVHSSTTIPKLYSSNTWTGSNIFSGTLTLGSLNGPLQVNNGAVSATTSIGVIYGGTGLTSMPNYGEVLVGNSSGGYTLMATSSLGITGGSTGDQIAVIVDQKAGGAAGGTFTAGAWRTRDLNTKLHDDIGVTVSSNQFTLPAGTYEFSISAPAYTVDRHQARLYNVTDAASAILGSTEFSQNSAAYATTRSFVRGTVTIASSKTFRVEHQASATAASDGFGIPTTFADNEVYTIVQIRKLNGSATVATFTGASASVNGTAGLVPQPQSGEQGSILLGNGSWLASTTLFVNSANGNIGIGSTSPNWKLSVAGDASFDSFARASYFTATSSTASVLPYASTTAITVSGTASTTNLVVSSAGGTAGCATFSSIGLLSNTGVACGTGAGGADFTFQSHFGSLTAATTSPTLFSGGLFASSTVRFGNAGVDNFLFDGTTGRLGLGTSTPGAMLSIAGDTIGNKFIGASFVATSSLASRFPYASTTAITATTASTTNLVISALQNGLLKVNASGVVSLAVAGTDYSNFAYLFPSNATSTLLSFNGGLSTSALTLGSLNGPLHANNGLVSATSSVGVLYGGTGLTTAPAYGQLLLGQADGTYMLTATSSLGITGGSTGDQIAIIVDQKADGTDGGTFTTGAWRTRDLNTELHDDIGVSISSNEFTLPAGTYHIRAQAPAYRVDVHIARLYNVTDATTEIVGSAAYNQDAAAYAVTSSYIDGVVTIASTKTFRIEHRGDVTSIYGLASTFTGVPEIYTQVQIRKLNGSATVATFTGASASTNGTAGLVPQPLSGEQGSVLLGDGSWLASTTLFVSTTTARIGIGTTTPWAKLSITSTAGIPQFLIGSSTTQFIVDKNGKVGIGTTTPLQRLTVGNVSSAANEFIHVLGQNNAGIIIEADTDNVTETHNPYIKFLQDGAAVAGILGLTGGADVDPEGTALTGALGNTLLLANHYSAGALQLGTNATARLTIDSTGNVGIGTTTPISTLSVQGSLCVRSTGSCGTTAGTIYATTAAISDIDLAENYRAIDVTLVPGEIVALLEGSTSTIRRAVQGEEGLGVLSTKPGLLLGQEIKDGRAVALKGRVPLKVNMEGGPIAVGDRLTVSSVAGVGTKATTSSYTVARALEAASTDGVIEVFVENEYTLVIDEKNALRDLLNATSTATSSPVFANIFARMTEWLAHAGNGITELFAKTIRAENVYADTVTANEICVKKSNGTHVCITGDEIESLMNGSPLPEPTPAPEPEPTPESDETTGGDEGEEVGDGGEGIVPSEDAAVPPADQATEPTAEVPATTSEDPVE